MLGRGLIAEHPPKEGLEMKEGVREFLMENHAIVLRSEGQRICSTDEVVSPFMPARYAFTVIVTFNCWQCPLMVKKDRARRVRRREEGGREQPMNEIVLKNKYS